eukprot:5621958-Prymnesium_polylepis.1
MTATAAVRLLSGCCQGCQALPGLSGWYHPRLMSDCQVAVRLAAVRYCHSCQALSWCISGLCGTRTTD